MKLPFIPFVLLVTSTVAGQACDLCGCYTPQLEAMPQMEESAALGRPTGISPDWAKGLYGAIGEQFTYFGTVQVDGNEVANPTGQHEESSISQFVAGYSLTPRFALQLNVPFIYRSFERPEGFKIDRGTVSGLGDIALLLKTVLFHYDSPGRREFNVEGKSPIAIEHEPDFTASVVLITGIKLPTGATSRIKEEFHEIDIPGAPPSGIHGHDLTLGTGSYDGIFGGQGSLRYQSFFFQADLQFALRGDGLHQYDFANDLSWSGGPGYYLIRRPDLIVGVQFVVSGEHKDVDRFRGEPVEDTGITSVYIGPRVVASFNKFSAELGADLPVSIDNTALQVVPDYRSRAGVSVHF